MLRSSTRASSTRRCSSSRRPRAPARSSAGCSSGSRAVPMPAQVAEITGYGAHEFYDFEAKYLGEEGVTLDVPANLRDDVIEQIQQLSVAAFEALDCEGLARVDFFVQSRRADLRSTRSTRCPASLLRRCIRGCGPSPVSTTRSWWSGCSPSPSGVRPACADKPLQPGRQTPASPGRFAWLAMQAAG